VEFLGNKGERTVRKIKVVGVYDTANKQRRECTDLGVPILEDVDFLSVIHQFQRLQRLLHVVLCAALVENRAWCMKANGD
jgi:hypothetical protein